MQNAQINIHLSGLLTAHGLSLLPLEVIDRDGRMMDVSGNVWVFNNAAEVNRHDWSRMDLTHTILEYAMKRYVVRVVELSSPKEAFNTVMDFRQLLTGMSFEPTDEEKASGCQNVVREQWVAIQHIEDLDELNDGIFVLMGHLVQALRGKNTLYRFHRLRAWFNWAADILPELAFSEEYALELNQIHVPGNTKGRAVETEDESGGPMWDDEVRAVRVALGQDKSTLRQHVKERAAVELGLVFGRNSANYVLLREEDFWNEMGDVPADEDESKVLPEWRLNIPRIKKRGVAARRQMLTEYVDNSVANCILDLIEANKSIYTGKYPRPLFMRDEADERRAGTGVDEFSFHLTTTDFGYLIQAFVKRMNIISPRTEDILKLSPRRLRYTFATSMVELGVAPKVLARMLDHTDTQHVMVYFALKGKRLTKHLDKAAAFKLAGFFQLFKGHVVDSDAEALNGDSDAKKMYFTGTDHPDSAIKIGVCGQQSLCLLDPPYSCYLCGLFQPYREANHDAVLETLLDEREERMEKYGGRLGIQLDDVIFAVTNVIKIIGAEGAVEGNG